MRTKSKIRCRQSASEREGGREGERKNEREREREREVNHLK